MARRNSERDNVVVAVIGGLTETEAENVSRGIMKQKRIYGHNGKGTIAVGKKDSVGGLLEKGHSNLIEDKSSYEEERFSTTRRWTRKRSNEEFVFGGGMEYEEDDSWNSRR